MHRRDDNSKAARKAHLPQLPGAYVGPMEPVQLLQEARACFVEGYFMAAILAAAAHVEHTLAEELELNGIVRNGDSLSFARAIELARTHSLFRDPEVLERLDALRLVRNPLTHRKADGHTHTIGARFRKQKRHPQLILEEDAKQALDLMHGLFFATMRPFDEGQA